LRLAAPAILPVVFTETELTAQQDLLEDQQVRMAFIKERLFSAAAAAGEENGEKLEGPTKKEESSD
jgi:hypothetical protein